MDLKEVDIFAYVDNFKVHEHIESIEIKKSEKDDYFLSIVIPTYKRSKELKEAIDSALNQEGDLFEYEVVVVDNNSDRGDETEQLIANYSNSNLSYFKNNENLGMFGNWNRGFMLAKGKWLTMLHDDDMLFPYFMSIIRKYLTSTNFAFASQHINGTEYKLIDMPTTISISKIKLSDFIFMSNPVGAPVGLTVAKEEFIATGGFNPDYYPVSDRLWYMIFVNKYTLYKINAPIAFYRTTLCTNTKLHTIHENLIKDYFVKRSLYKYRYKLPYPVVDYILGVCELKHYEQRKSKGLGDCGFKLSDIGLEHLKLKGGIYDLSTNFTWFLWRVCFKLFH